MMNYLALMVQMEEGGQRLRSIDMQEAAASQTTTAETSC